MANGSGDLANVQSAPPLPRKRKPGPVPGFSCPYQSIRHSISIKARHQDATAPLLRSPVDRAERSRWRQISPVRYERVAVHLSQRRIRSSRPQSSAAPPGCRSRSPGSKLQRSSATADAICLEPCMRAGTEYWLCISGLPSRSPCVSPRNCGMTGTIGSAGLWC